MKILLASASPRRRELLRWAGVEFSLHSPDIDETPRRGELPAALVKRLARAKAEASLVKLNDELAVVSADTVVALGKRVMNKPRDDREAVRMLTALSGQAHDVFTGCCVLYYGFKPQTFAVKTQVKFRELSKADIQRYVAGGEGRDKAGAYAVQGEGSSLIEWVRGSYTNVIGLPVAEVLSALRQPLLER